MTIKQVAEMLDRSVASVRVYIKAEGLPCSRDARGRLVFDEAEVQEWHDRPETRLLLALGDMTKRGRRNAVA